MKPSVRLPLAKKPVALARSRKQLVMSVEAIKVTPEVQHRAEQMTAAARRAKAAPFLAKYRAHLPT